MIALIDADPTRYDMRNIIFYKHLIRKRGEDEKWRENI